MQSEHSDDDADNLSLSYTEDQSRDTEDYLFHVGPSSKLKTVTINVDNVDMNFIIDSGSSCDMIDWTSFLKIRDSAKVFPSKAKVFVYGSTKPLQLHGVFYPTLTMKNSKLIRPVLISPISGAGCILSKETSTMLGLLQLNESPDYDTVMLADKQPERNNSTNTITSILGEFSGIYKIFRKNQKF